MVEEKNSTILVNGCINNKHYVDSLTSKEYNKLINSKLYDFYTDNGRENIEEKYIMLFNKKVKGFSLRRYLLWFLLNIEKDIHKLNLKNRYKENNLRQYIIFKKLDESFMLDLPSFFKESEEVKNILKNRNKDIQKIKVYSVKRKENKLLSDKR